MISLRLELNEDIRLNSASPKSSSNLESKFLHVLHFTREQSSKSLDPGAEFFRSLHAYSEPCAFIMRNGDLTRLQLFAKHSEERNSDRAKLAGVSDEEILQETVKVNQTPITKYKDLKNLLDSHIPIMLNPSRPISEIYEAIKEIKSQFDQDIKLRADLSDEFKIWSKYGLLPYFDLKAWARITGQRLRNQDIHELIWPPGQSLDMSEEAIKKTTSRYFRKVFSRSMLKKL